MPTSTVYVRFLGDSASAVRATGQLDKSLGGLGRTSGRVAGILAVGIVGGLAVATKAAISFDKEMRNVNSIARLSEKEFQRLSKQVRGLSKETAKGPSDLARGLYDLVSSGFDANESIKILRVSAKAATAGLTDTKTATKAVAAALNAYHLEADDARKVSDILFQTVNKGVLTFEELAQQMGDLVPAAAPLGITLEEVGAAIATITLQGVPAAEAATRVKNTFLQLASPSKALSALLKENGFASGEAAIQAKGFVGVLQLLQRETQGNVTKTAALTPEIRSLMGVVGLTGKNLDVYLKNLRSMEQAQSGAGATARAFSEQGKSISFQWQRAKAALEAAAIPIGELLFPALESGAGKVEDFADALPRLQAQLGPVVSAVGDLAHVSFELARTDAGQFGLLTALSTVAAASTVSRVGSLVASIRALPPGLSLAVGAVGLLGGAFLFAATRGDRLKSSIQGVIDASRELRETSLEEAQAQLRVSQAQTQVRASALNLESAKKALAAAEREFGKGSIEARTALVNLKAAQDQVKQSALDLTRAKREAAAADRETKAALKAVSEAQSEAADTAADLVRQQVLSRGGAVGLTHALDANTTAGERARQKLAEYGDAVAAAFRKLGASKKQADIARQAVDDLTAALGRVPTFKEIRIFVRQYGSITGATGALRPRAGGGFVPMVPGASRGRDSVGILATPGEIVLNRQQQEILGGPRYLAQLFGFTGSEGPTFQGGGIVGHPTSGRRPPHRPLRGRPWARTSKAARAALAAVERVNQSQANLDRGYGQLAREYGISEEVFIVTGEGDVEALDESAVAGHVGEIDSLIAHRNRMLSLLDAERERLSEAIEALRKAIDALLEAMRQEERAAQEDATRIRELAARLRSSERAEERLRAQPEPKNAAGRKARERELSGLDREQDSLRRQIERGESSRRAHLDKRSTLASRADEFRTALGVARGALVNEVPFDRRDVELDVMELRRQRADVLAVRARPAPAPLPPVGGEGAGGGEAFGSITAGLGDTGELEALRRQVEELTRQLGLANLGLAIEGRQLGVIREFQRGTVHVNTNQLAWVHAGERIMPAGVSGSTVVEGPPVIVQIAAKDGALAELIDVRVLRNAGALSDAMGRRADLRARGGRY